MTSFIQRAAFLSPGVVLILSFVFSLPSNAQYFGRNKVQYDDFDFQIMHTNNFDVYFYDREAESVKDAARMIERWHSRYTKLLNHKLPPKQPLILYANHADFQQTNVISNLISQGTGGVTEGLERRIVLPLTGAYSDNDHVLGHELVHAFQYHIAIAQKRGIRALSQQPLWFIEGMAEYLSSGSSHPHTAMWMRDAVSHDDVPTIKQVGRDQRYFPYRYGHAIWAYIAGKWGDDVVGPIYRRAMTLSLDSTFQTILGISRDSLSSEWQQALRQTYNSQLEGRTKPNDVGEKILAKDLHAGGMNMAPAISPDGSQVAFLSEKDLFTIDLFLADAHTGKIKKKLVSANTDAHFDALRFMNSAGAWSPDGKLFAFVVFKDGENAISIVEVASGDVKRTIKTDSIGAIYHLSWSPDGRQLVFSGSEAGLSDLYLYNLDRGTTRQLTNDRYADLQPAWSPDGEKIVFVTDRGPGTDMSILKTGPMQLAMFEVKTGEMKLLDIFRQGKHINPQFSPDGKEIYFVADPDGFNNVYRYSLVTGEIFQITNVATGISGLTELSPCLAVARQSGRMMFSVFEKTNYNVYALETAKLQAKRIYPAKENLLNFSSLPPLESTAVASVNEYLDEYRTTLPADTQYKITDYNASLGLKYIGQISIGAAADRFGTSLGGGTSLLFGDMLNNHMLGIVAQINGGIKDLGGQVVYQNRKNRYNWGAAVSHIPIRTERVSVGTVPVEVNGQTVAGRALIFNRLRTFYDQATLLGDYPLSTNRRFSANLGFTRISFDREVEQVVTVGGTVVDRQTEDLPAPDGLNLVQGGLAYVGDYSFFGFTSPINGRRFRFEAQPTVGTLQYLTILTDYRKYFFWNPFTMAFRAYHYGRYFLNEEENNRLTPLFIGYETFVRGYNFGSFTNSECSEGDSPGDCPEFDRLLGSRIGVFNAEFRFPLFGTEQFGLINFPYLPTELALFFDGGVAWTADESPEFKLKEKSKERIPVFSTGMAVRVNLFGALVGQVYYAIPFQRPQKDGLFGFVIALGW